MDLLFKRSQATGWLGRVKFKLWGKTELDDEEKELIKRYQLDKAVLIAATQPGLIKRSIFMAILALIVAFLFLSIASPILGYIHFAIILPILHNLGYFPASDFGPNFVLAFMSALIYGFWYYQQKRETIYVRDLMHGRYFKCDSIIELARKEAWLETICAFLRQVMESAKHWDGETRFPIEALPKDEAKQIIIKGI